MANNAPHAERAHTQSPAALTTSSRLAWPPYRPVRKGAPDLWPARTWPYFSPGQRFIQWEAIGEEGAVLASAHHVAGQEQEGCPH